MPNAAASLDTDYGMGAATRRRPPRAAPRKKGRKRSLAVAGSLFSKMPRYGAIAITTLIGVGIVVNALMMQHGHHSAPLFDAAAGKPTPAKATAHEAAQIAEASKAAAEPKAAPVAAAELPPTPPAAPRAEPANRAPARATKATRGDDPIGRLINAPQAQHRGKNAAEKHRRNEG